jgi:nicotinate-nucleotide pyrophosphorylase (carboxylating)
MMKDKEEIRAFLRAALHEDVGDGDHTTLATMSKDAMGSARLLVKDEGVLSGVEIAQMVFEEVDPTLQFEKILDDGARITRGDVAFLLHGHAASITIGERLALNIMQRMSGIATKTDHMSQLIAHTSCKLLDTRKTTPGFRYFEKLAVRHGGGVNHRFGLYDMILVKDNHIDYCGGVKAALQNVKNYLSVTGKNLQVEVEARNMDEIKAILEEKIAFRILLDNFSPADLKVAVEYIHGEVLTEASGGIDENTIAAYAETGVDFISIGALTHQISSLDLSLKAVK